MTRRVVAFVVLAVFCVPAFSAVPAGAARKPNPCKIVKPKRMTALLGMPVSGPGKPSYRACDFDVAGGPGEAGGGKLWIQLQLGGHGKIIWGLKQLSATPIPGLDDAVFDSADNAAYVYGEDEGLVTVELSLTDAEPDPDTLAPQIGAIAEAAFAKL